MEDSSKILKEFYSQYLTALTRGGPFLIPVTSACNSRLVRFNTFVAVLLLSVFWTSKIFIEVNDSLIGANSDLRVLFTKTSILFWRRGSSNCIFCGDTAASTNFFCFCSHALFLKIHLLLKDHYEVHFFAIQKSIYLGTTLRDGSKYFKLRRWARQVFVNKCFFWQVCFSNAFYTVIWNGSNFAMVFWQLPVIYKFEWVVKEFNRMTDFSIVQNHRY